MEVRTLISYTTHLPHSKTHAQSHLGDASMNSGFIEKYRLAFGIALVLFTALIGTGDVRGETNRVLPEGNLPADQRLEKPKDLDGYFPFTPPTNMKDWEARKERVQRQLLVAN